MFRIGRKILGIALIGLTVATQFGCKSKDEVDLQGNWFRSGIPDFGGIPRSSAVSFVIADSAFVGTGYSNQLNSLKDFWKFNSATKSWSQIADFGGVIRNDAVGFAAAGKGYVGLGYNTNAEAYQKDFWTYSTVNNKWTVVAKAFPGTARQFASAFVVADKAYVGLGYDGTNLLQDIYKFDPATGAWTEASSFSNKRRGAVAFSLNGKGYLGFGVNNAGLYRSDIWEFDPAAGTNGVGSWTLKTTLKVDDKEQGRAFAVPLILGDKVYLVGGTSGSALSTVWEWATVGNTWTQKTSFEGTARNFAVGFVVGGKPYYGTGALGTRFDDMWSFEPTVAKNDNDNQ